MTTGHEDELKRLWQRLERLAEDVYGDGATGGVATHLARLAQGQEALRADILGVKEEVRGVKEEAKKQNGSINDLKLAAAEAKGIALGTTAERELWQTNIKWLFMAGISSAGVMSGIVFGLISWLLR